MEKPKRMKSKPYERHIACAYPASPVPPLTTPMRRPSTCYGRGIRLPGVPVKVAALPCIQDDISGLCEREATVGQRISLQLNNVDVNLVMLGEVVEGLFRCGAKRKKTGKSKSGKSKRKFLYLYRKG